VRYSYIDATLSAGYSILVYDRLGVGQSDKPDAYKIAQGPIQIEILNQIIVLARAGTFSKMSAKYQHLTNPKFDKIVAIRHSLGSIVTSEVLRLYGDVVNVAVLTGYVPSKYVSALKQQAHGLEFARSHDG
jgi:pimeloyl-ACP methyl ester carboxylesterase